MVYQIITEGKAKAKVPVEKKISKDLPVFYNPVMKLNRDITVLLLEAAEKNNMRLCLPLEGTGIRSIRLLKELSKAKIESICINDIDKEAFKIIKDNLKINGYKDFLEIKTEKDFDKKKLVKIANMDANKLMIISSGFDFIDIDPFGSPNFLLNNAITRLSREGILAVTATDTACLSGTFPMPCMRKYWAVPSRDENMHENGLRILIRKVQLIGADHEKALVPVLSYSKDHYFRVFFMCAKGKQKADEIVKQMGMMNGAGPMWLGKLYDTAILGKMLNISEDIDVKKFVSVLYNESKIDIPGFHNIPKLCKRNKLSLKKQEEIIRKIEQNGYAAARTHFRDDCIRSDIPESELIEILKEN